MNGSTHVNIKLTSWKDTEERKLLALFVYSFFFLFFFDILMDKMEDWKTNKVKFVLLNITTCGHNSVIRKANSEQRGLGLQCISGKV